MAKKDPTDLSVEEKLKALYQLQTTLSAIDEKKALRGELPLEVQDLEDEIEGLTIRVDKIRREIDEFQKAVSQKKAEINEAQASVERYKMQLDEGGAGRVAGRVFAFVGVTLACAVIAVLAALVVFHAAAALRQYRKRKERLLRLARQQGSTS